MPQVGDRGRHDTHDIEAVMVVKALILDRDDRVNQIGRDLLERHVDALLFEDGEDQRVGVVVHRRRLIHLPDTTHRRLIGKAIAVQRLDNPAASDDRSQRERREGERDRAERPWAPAERGAPVRENLMRACAGETRTFDAKPCNSKGHAVQCGYSAICVAFRLH